MDEYGHSYPWQIVSRATGTCLTCNIMKEIRLDSNALRSGVVNIVSRYSPVGHSRFDHHDGGWNAIGLISHEGDPFEDRYLGPFLKKTPALSLAPYIEKFLDGIKAEKMRVRLLELQPGKSILWHCDKRADIDTGKYARLHIPIFTNKDVRVQISHEDLVWNPGEVWYGDFSFPHRVYNGGQESRVHLVIDLAMGKDVYALFPGEFVDQKAKRAKVRKICQNLYRSYAVGRLPRIALATYLRGGLQGVVDSGLRQLRKSPKERGLRKNSP